VCRSRSSPSGNFPKGSVDPNPSHGRSKVAAVYASHLTSHRAPTPSCRNGLLPTKWRLRKKSQGVSMQGNTQKKSRESLSRQTATRRARAPLARKTWRKRLVGLGAWRSTVPCLPCNKKTPISGCEYVRSKNTLRVSCRKEKACRGKRGPRNGKQTKNPRKENFASASGFPNGTTGRVLAVAYTRK